MRPRPLSQVRPRMSTGPQWTHVDGPADGPLDRGLVGKRWGSFVSQKRRVRSDRVKQVSVHDPHEGATECIAHGSSRFRNALGNQPCAIIPLPPIASKGGTLMALLIPGEDTVGKAMECSKAAKAKRSNR